MFVKICALVTVLAVVQAGLLDGHLGGGGGGGEGGGHEIHHIEYAAPPKYEYKFAVHDHHTGDKKEKVEHRHGDLTKSDYAYGEKDRKIHVSRVIHSSIPVKVVGKY